MTTEQTEVKIAEQNQTEGAAPAAPSEPTTKKEVVVTKTHRIWMYMALFMVGLAVVVGVVRTVVDNRSTAIAHAVMQQYTSGNQFEVAIIDPVKIVEEFREQGADEMRAYRALALFLSILEEDKVIAINAQSTVTAPSASIIHALPYERIEEIARNRGIDVEQYQEDMINQAREQAEEVMRQLSEALGDSTDFNF